MALTLAELQKVQELLAPDRAQIVKDTTSVQFGDRELVVMWAAVTQEEKDIAQRALIAYTWPTNFPADPVAVPGVATVDSITIRGGLFTGPFYGIAPTLEYGEPQADQMTKLRTHNLHWALRKFNPNVSIEAGKEITAFETVEQQTDEDIAAPATLPAAAETGQIRNVSYKRDPRTGKHTNKSDKRTAAPVAGAAKTATTNAFTERREVTDRNVAQGAAPSTLPDALSPVTGKIVTETRIASEFPGKEEVRYSEDAAVAVASSHTEASTRGAEIILSAENRNVDPASAPPTLPDTPAAVIGAYSVERIEKSEYPGKVHKTLTDNIAVMLDTGWRTTPNTYGGTDRIRTAMNLTAAEASAAIISMRSQGQEITGYYYEIHKRWILENSREYPGLFNFHCMEHGGALKLIAVLSEWDYTNSDLFIQEQSWRKSSGSCWNRYREIMQGVKQCMSSATAFKFLQDAKTTYGTALIHAPPPENHGWGKWRAIYRAYTPTYDGQLVNRGWSPWYDENGAVAHA